MALMPVGLFSIFEKNSEMLVNVPQMQRRRDTKINVEYCMYFELLLQGLYS